MGTAYHGTQSKRGRMSKEILNQIVDVLMSVVNEKAGIDTLNRLADIRKLIKEEPTNKTITVCDSCLSESCLKGDFCCENYKTAGTKEIPAKEEE